VPDIKDLDKIEKMLDGLGERELELGEVTAEDLLRMEQEYATEELKGGTGAREEGVEPGIGGEEAAAGGAGEEEDDFAALLKDIQIGLEEEKEFEGLIAGEEAPEVSEPETKSPFAEETFGVTGPAIEEPSLTSGIEYIPEEAEISGKAEETEVGPPKMPEAEISEIEAETSGELPAEEMPETESAELSGVQTESGALEEGADLDLPEDFDFEDVDYEERPLEGLVSAGEAVEAEGDETAREPVSPEVQEPAAHEMPEGPVVSEETPAGGFEEMEMPDLESLETLHEEIGGELPEPPETPVEEEVVEPHAESTGEMESVFEIPGVEEREEVPGEEPQEGAGPVEEEEFEFPGFELPEFEPGERAPADVAAGEELTPVEGEAGITEEFLEMPELEGEETALPSEEFPFEELLSEELPSEEVTEELPPEEPPSGGLGIEEPPFEETPSGRPSEEFPEEAPVELTDEDIVVIKAKLKQLNPQLASFVRDSILAGNLPVAIVNEMLRHLLTDAPEQEIIGFVEQTTGQKLAARRAVPGIITVERKPGPLENIYRSLGPLVRVSGLFIIIMVILGVLFMLFMYKPMRASRYYKEGIRFIENAQYELAEQSFTRGKQIYLSVKQYDKFGWEYMISGNYDAARRKFVSGIKLDEGVRNLNIRLHMARLHAVLGEYADADILYDEVLEKSPDTYEYIRLKGTNLIEWGKSGEADKLDEAYDLFSTAYNNKPKASDPLFKMLSIDIYQGKGEDITRLYKYITNRFPQDVDPEVYTALASYFIAHEQFGKVRDILLQVLNRDPAYPKAYMTFANYYKAIKNPQMQEEFLQSAITYENKRLLQYPWDKRDRMLLSDTYNDLGEIYAGMDTPGRAAESIRYFKKSIDQNRRNMKAYYNLAQVYFYKERNYSLAKQYYEAAERGGFRNYDLDYNLGLLYYYERSFSKALERWSQLAEIFPDNPNIVYAMGGAMLHLGKYNAALGEFMLLSEVYDDLVQKLGEIKPWRAYHKRILLESAAVLNNLGVAYQKLAENTGDEEYQKESLLVLYKAGELADITGTERGKIQYNINYILHPDVIRGSMAIDDKLSDNYRFIIQ